MNVPPSQDSGIRDLKLLSVVVPCFNEEQSLRDTHQSLVEVLSQDTHGYDVEFLYVDDGSTDASLTILRELQLVDARAGPLRPGYGGMGRFPAGTRVLPTCRSCSLVSWASISGGYMGR